MSQNNPDEPPAERAFISYSHDSAEHRARVLALADRLRAGGIDCWIDQYVPAPPEGWPNWMRRQIRDAKYVLVVCTETYQRRVDLLEDDPGRGLGSTWEGGLITHSAFDGQGRNEKFIPVVFSEEDARYIPDFLRGVTRYDVSDEADYTALYARLTGQQLVAVPPLGPRRKVGVSHGPPQATELPRGSAGDAQHRGAPGTLVLLEDEKRRRFLQADRIEEEGGCLYLNLVRTDREDTTFLAEWNEHYGESRVWVAYEDRITVALVDGTERSVDAEGESWWVVLVPVEEKRGDLSEMASAGKSADDIAELRARRILLDERPPEEIARWGRPDEMLETLVRGLGGSHVVRASPLPPLFQELGGDRTLFLDAARLVSVLELRRTGTIAHVLELDFRMEDATSLRVHFRGRRRKIYSNAPAHEITVDGVCSLRAVGG